MDEFRGAVDVAPGWQFRARHAPTVEPLALQQGVMQGGGGDALSRRQTSAQSEVGAQDVEGRGDDALLERTLTPSDHLAEN